jgi:hypothetical protein
MNLLKFTWRELMNTKPLLIASAIVVGLAMPATAQQSATMIGPTNSSTQAGTSIPNLSGVWTHLYLGLEPPISGPGPVTNRSRRNGARSVYQYVGDYTNPTLKPQAAEIVKQRGEISLTGVTLPNPTNQCWPGGVPYAFWNYAIHLIQQPHQITILYDNNEFRHVRMNEPHQPQAKSSWYGDSVGHYEGDTLVIDTVGVKIGPFSMVDIYGTPYTKALHVVERYRMVDHEAAKEAQDRGQKENGYRPNNDSGLTVDPNYKGKGLQVEFTVEDEGVFTMPWSGTDSYWPGLGEWQEYVCAENPNEFVRKVAVPYADKPDF